jgi:hypothetical protein
MEFRIIISEEIHFHRIWVEQVQSSKDTGSKVTYEINRGCIAS